MNYDFVHAPTDFIEQFNHPFVKMLWIVYAAKLLRWMCHATFSLNIGLPMSSYEKPWWKKAVEWIVAIFIVVPLYYVWAAIMGVLIMGGLYLAFLFLDYIFGRMSSGSLW